MRTRTWALILRRTVGDAAGRGAGHVGDDGRVVDAAGRGGGGARHVGDDGRVVDAAGHVGVHETFSAWIGGRA